MGDFSCAGHQASSCEWKGQALPCDRVAEVTAVRPPSQSLLLREPGPWPALLLPTNSRSIIGGMESSGMTGV